MNFETVTSRVLSVEPNDAIGWVGRCRIVSIDGYQPPLYPDRIYDAKFAVELTKELNGNVIRVSAMGKLAHFKTMNWEMDEYIRKHDYIGEVIERAHAAGIKVVAYIPGAHHLPFELLMKWHPEWIQRSYPEQPLEDTPKLYHAGTLNGRVCPIGPYREFYEEMIKEVIMNHDVDGWYSDAWKVHYFNSVCYCEACRSMFGKDTGNDLYSKDFIPGGSRENEVVSWYHKSLVRMVQKEHADVMQKKRVPTIINNISGVLGYQPQGEWAKEVDSIHDVAHFERKVDPYNRFVSASYLNVKGEKAWFYAGIYSRLHLGTPELDGDDFAEKNYADERIFPFRKELYNECMIPFACGQAVNSYRCNSFAFDEKSPGKKIMQDVFGIVKNNSEVFEGISYYPFAGVLSLETSRFNFDGRLVKVLLREGLQTTIIKKEDLEDLFFLKKFSVIITEKTGVGGAGKLLDYVQQGGRWITNDEGLKPEELGAAVLNCPQGMKAYAYGRGVIAIAAAEYFERRPTQAVSFICGGYLPYHIKYATGELIPILSVKEGLWALHLVNISSRLEGTYDSGLEAIPEIRNIRIDFMLPGNTKLECVRFIRRNEIIKASETGNGCFSINLEKMDEYECIIMKLGKI